MTTEKRDYSKLRPFDLEAVRDRGEAIIDTDGDAVAYLAGPSAKDEICVDMGAFGFGLAIASDLRMAPLAWVRKSADEDVLWPVYKGDVLWHPSKGKYTVDMLMSAPGKVIALHESGFFSFLNLHDVDELTFTPPKVKREGWVNVYSNDKLVDKETYSGFVTHAFATKELADKNTELQGERLNCIRIECEEPAGQEGGPQ